MEIYLETANLDSSPIIVYVGHYATLRVLIKNSASLSTSSGATKHLYMIALRSGSQKRADTIFLQGPRNLGRTLTHRISEWASASCLFAQAGSMCHFRTSCFNASPHQLLSAFLFNLSAEYIHTIFPLHHSCFSRMFRKHRASRTSNTVTRTSQPSLRE